MSKTTTVVNVKKTELNKRGIKNFAEWNAREDTVYIGGNAHVPGMVKSKWCNPYSLRNHTQKQCLALYTNYVVNEPNLMNSLDELEGKELGCWCKPDGCHGDVLINLMN